MTLSGCLAIRRVSLFWAAKSAEINPLTIGDDPRPPRLTVSGARVEGNALESRRVVNVDFPIPQVFRLSTDAQIFAPIVQPVAVLVIDYPTAFAARYKPMQTPIADIGTVLE
jgi:hypothetical protein